MIRILSNFYLKRLADFQAKIILALVFILLLPVFALIHKMINQKKGNNGWIDWKIKSDSLEDLKRQY